MKQIIKLATIGALGAVTITTALAATEQAGADHGSGNEAGVVKQDASGGNGGDAVARGGNAVARGGDGGDGGVSVSQDGDGAVVPGEDGEDAVASGEDGVAVRGEDGEDGASIVNGEDAALEAGQISMKMKGDEGVEFSGTCTVNGEEQVLEGQVPQEFTFEIGEGKLDCEMRKEGKGKLKMVLVSGNDRIVQTMNGDSTLKLTYSGDGVSSTTSGSSSSVVQSN